MKKLCDDILCALRENKGAVLLSVVQRRGSAPRGLGAAMLLLENGAQRGTVGGGAVEYAAAGEAMELFDTRGARMLTYRLSASEIAGAGMICGGTVRVLAQYLAPTAENCALFEGLVAARDRGAQAALVRRLDGGAVVGMGYWDGTALHGVEAASPVAPGARAWLSEDETLLWEPVSLGARAVIFGGGHVSQKLAPLLDFIGFRCVICEDRAAFADAALFPAAERVLLGDFSDIGTFLTIRPEDFAVVMTRGHQADYEILRQLLSTRARYIGCIGSRHKIALTRGRLMDDGFSAADCARVHTPIGLPIGAETPEEIAVSIAAELIQVRAQSF